MNKKLVKVVTFVVALVFVVGCGRKDRVVEVEVEVEKIVAVAQDFEGTYLCDNNSYLELIADYKDRITFETSGQSMNSINPQNGTVGTHPVIGERDVVVVGGDRLLIAPRNYTYSSSTHDLENDLTGSNVTGSRRTDVEVKKVSDNKISVKFEIYSGAVNSNVNGIIITREFVCEK